MSIENIDWTPGTCQRCNMRGMVKPKMVLGAMDLDAMTGDTPESVPVSNLCVTCYDTPTGFPSTNEEHKRLPEAEYRQDKSPT